MDSSITDLAVRERVPARHPGYDTMKLHEMLAHARDVGAEYADDMTSRAWSEDEAWGALYEALVDRIGFGLTDCSDLLRDRLMDEARETARALLGVPAPTWTVSVDGIVTTYQREGQARAAAQRAARDGARVVLSEHRADTWRPAWAVRVEACRDGGRWDYTETEGGLMTCPIMASLVEAYRDHETEVRR